MRKQRFEPGPGTFDDRLPMSTALPLWLTFSMLGWLLIAYSALLLARSAPYLA